MEDIRPKITVITPAYNRAKFIKETIESVLVQDYQDFEYLILDDGSTDNTKEVVRPFLKDKRVKYLYHRNQGEAETVNWGWRLARGEYFTQVNSDDPILPGLFSEMVKNLDLKKDAVLAYPDFYFIDEVGKITKKIKNPNWDLIKHLSNFACYAASPGTFIRRKSFFNWTKIKDGKFKHTNDINMYWQMALQGNFNHIPKFLATWRSHKGGISFNRHEAIPEIEDWLIKKFLNRNDLPKNIERIKIKTISAAYKYFINLLEEINIGDQNKKIYFYKNKLGLPHFSFDNLQIGDNDLIGNKFNGHDLHLYLRESGIDSKHLVWNKESNDENTFIIAGNKKNRLEILKNSLKIQKQYELNSFQNPIAYDILYNDLFLKTNIVHYHLIHNFIFDLSLLPILTRLKPSVWTIHDPWSLGGHCIYHFNCKKWHTQCEDCPHLDTHFALFKDNSALNYELKKSAIQNSKLDIVVASKWMKKKVDKSPMFKNAKVHLIPFGINQDIFRSLDKVDVRKKLKIPKESFVISFRCDASQFKGLEYIEYALKHIKTNKKIFLLVFAGPLRENPNNYPFKEMGWVKNDILMAEAYNASDLFLMPSTMEAFGMMAIEAMSCGVLPIVLEGTSLPDIVNSKECGISSKRNKKEFFQLVEYYIDNDIERIKRAKKCLAYAQKKYKKERYINDITKLYREVIKKHRLNNYDSVLLKQLKKHMSIKPVYKDEETNVKFFRKLTLISFYKIDKLFPKIVRLKVKEQLFKIKIIKKLLTIN